MNPVHPFVLPALGAAWPLGRLLGAISPCTVGTGCTVQADLESKMAFGAPTWALYAQNELQLASQVPSRRSLNPLKTFKSVELSSIFAVLVFCASYALQVLSDCI